MTLLELPNMHDKNETKSKRGKKTPPAAGVGRRLQPLPASSKPESPTHGKKKSRMRGRGEQQQQRHHAPKKMTARGGTSSSSSYVPSGSPNSKSGGGPTSKVPHDMPMGKKDLYFALDCEMVGVGPHGVDSALARVSIVNYDREIVLDTFVQVSVPVTDYRTFVSGVRSEDLLASGTARTLEQTRRAVMDILRGKILIGHGLDNDLKALMIVHPWCDTRDTATYVPYMREIAPTTAAEATTAKTLMVPRRLKDLSLERLGKKIQVYGRAHSPIEDSLAALELYKAVRPEWEHAMCAQVKKANDMENSRLFKSLRLPTLGRRVQVQPAPLYAAPPPAPPPSLPASVRQQQHPHKQQQQQQYVNLPPVGHPAMPPVVNPNNLVYMGDGRPLYYVPMHHTAYKNAAHFRPQQQQPLQHPSFTRKQTRQQQAAATPTFLRRSVPSFHTN